MQLFYGWKYLIVSNTADINSLIGSGEGRREKDERPEEAKIEERREYERAGW